MFTKLAEDVQAAANTKLASRWARVLTALRESKGLPAPTLEEISTIARNATYTPREAYLPPRRWNMRNWMDPVGGPAELPSLDWNLGREGIKLPPLEAKHGPLSPEMTRYINSPATYDPQFGDLWGL